MSFFSSLGQRQQQRRGGRVNTIIVVSPDRQKQIALLIGIFMVVALTLAVVFWVILDDYGAWHAYVSDTCNALCENSDKCNHDIDNRPVIQQPVNAWTSLGYILVGMCPLFLIRVDISTIAYALTNFYAGISSFIYHASISIYWKERDAGSMYTMFLVLVFHGIHSVTGISWRWLGPPLLAVGITFSFVIKGMDEMTLGSIKMSYIFGGCIIFLEGLIVAVRIGVRAMKTRRQQDGDINDEEETETNGGGDTIRSQCRKGCILVLWAVCPVAVAIFAAYIRNKDSNKTWCQPDSFFQGHAAWHFLTAFASLMVWMFFDCNRLKDFLAEIRSSSREEESNNDRENGGDDDDDIPSKVDIHMDMTDETFDLQEAGSSVPEKTDPEDSEPIIFDLAEQTLELQLESTA